MLSKKQSQFVAAIIAGTPAGAAYKAAFEPQTDNPDCLRALASKERHKPAVAAAIETGLQTIQADAINSALWSRRASIVARMKDLAQIESEISRRSDGLRIEIDGIRNDPDLTDAQKAQRIGRAMQRPVCSRDLVAAKQAIYAALDEIAGTDGDKPELSMAARILQLSIDAIKEDPDAYTAPPPAKTYPHL